MENKLVIANNTTDKVQTVIDITTNKPIEISPGMGCSIDIYNPKHTYLYKSYQRKGLLIEYVNESEFKKPRKLESVEDKKPTEVPDNIVESKKSKRNRKSNEDSENSKEVATESGE